MNKAEIKEQLETQLNQITNEVSEICGRLLKSKRFGGLIEPTREDKFKLLNLKTWAERYFLPLEEVISVLLKEWRERSKIKKALQMQVSTKWLVNNRSTYALQEYVTKTYPNRENEGLFKDALREKILPIAEPLSIDDPLEFVTRYKKHLSVLRDTDKFLENKFKRRNWRGIPW